MFFIIVIITINTCRPFHKPSESSLEHNGSLAELGNILEILIIIFHDVHDLNHDDDHNHDND